MVLVEAQKCIHKEHSGRFVGFTPKDFRALERQAQALEEKMSTVINISIRDESKY